jgi:hypothetical protein
MTQTPSADLAWARLAAVAAAVVVIAAHGLAHLMGGAFVVRAGKAPARRCRAPGIRPARSACTAHQR